MASEGAAANDATSSALGRPDTSRSIGRAEKVPIEKASIDSAEANTETGTTNSANHDEARFESIRPATGTSAGARATGRSAVRTRSSGMSTRSSLSRVRSYNGYGCDEYDEPGSSEEGAGGDPEKGQGAQAREKDPFEVGFEGGNADPWCPRSMNPARKWAIVGLTSMGSFCVTCASSIYTSTYTQMNAEFGCSRIVATLGLSMFVLGIALGPMWSPLSEFYGRRPIYLASFAVFTVWIVPTAVARNIGTVIVSRFFQGLSGSAFLSVSGGTVGDLFTPNKMHYPMIMFTAAPFLGPSFGPMIGGFINSNVNWRWTHYMLIIWAFLMCLALVVTVPETYHPVVLRNKARKIRKDTGDERWKAPIEKTNKSLFRTVGVSLMRPFQILIFEPMALVLNLYSAILLGILYLFFGAFPLVFQGTYGFNLWQTGLTFLGMLVGMFFAALMGPLWVKIRAQLIEKNEKVTGIEGKAEPEYRLPSAILGSFLVTIGLFWFGWASFPWVHWIMPIIGSGIFGAGVSPSLSHFLLYDHLLWHNGGLFV
ncbi:major facilitator superfamily transporter [Diaporthe sp. PMI_573]|nr:major facilitator superfamily transporter [Diaporthaceae sp. PMI_573]